MKSLGLLKDKNFSAFFWTQFWGAFNDNFFKNALVILITFRAAEKLGVSASILVTLCAGLFILPFFLFSATAGQIADKYEKSFLIRRIKIFEMIIMSFAVLGFLSQQIYFLLFVLFMMGFQSTLFGPIKYSIIPQLTQKEELVAANALIEIGTFLSILLGTILGGLAIIQVDYGAYITSLGVLFFAFLGWRASLKISKAEAVDTSLNVDWNFIKQTAVILKYTKQNANVFYAVIGISWFWFFGASYLSLFPSYGKEYLLGDEYVVNALLACFSVGIGIGSLVCEKSCKGVASFSLVPVAMLGMSVTSLLLMILSPGSPVDAPLIGLLEYLSNIKNVGIFISLILFAMFGGMYIVPLYSLVQKWSDRSILSRVIAGNNIINSLFMVISSLMIMSFLKASFSIPQIFGILAGLNLLFCILLLKKLSKSVG